MRFELKKVFLFAGFFLLGAIIVLIPCVVVIARRSSNECPAPTTPSVTTSAMTTSSMTTLPLITSSVTTPSMTTPSVTTSLVTTTTSSNPTWNASDYQSNSDYYNSSVNPRNFDQSDNLRLDRLSSPQFRPINGKSIIYLRRQYHMPDLRGSTTTLHWLDIETNKTIQLTRPIWGKHDQQFFWIDNNTILFLSNRASTGLNQIFQLTLPENVSQTIDFIDPIQITNYPLDIDNLLVNRQATRLAFSCQVYANLTIQQTVDRQLTEQASGRSIYQFDKLFVRHWDEYMTGRRHHPFLVQITRQTNGIFNFSSEPIDILFPLDSDSPTRPFGDAKAQWSFSASGNSFAYTRQYDETSEVAWTTNLDIWTIDLTTPGQSSVCITKENLATDTDPSYSPTDNNILVYRSHSIPRYESDQFKVKVYNGSNTKITLLDNWDRSIQALTWSRDGQSLYLETGEEAENVIYYISNIFTNQTIVPLTRNGTSHNINLHPIDDQIFVFTYESILEPANIYLYSSSDSIRPLTIHNKVLLSKVKMSTVAEKFSFAGAKNDTVWGWHIPPQNGTNNSAPLAFLIHGGPQSSWYNAWSYRWNFQSFSSQGYAVIAINFHGSDSYGQNFTDSINSNYGSLPYEDLQLGLDYALTNYPYIDSQRATALGASYGGYMVNWIAGHPEMSLRFKTFVTHNGALDTRSKSYSSDELWFTEYDAGNFTPWDNPDAFEIYNPVNHVANWTQPMLIIVGARDYRIPETQGIGTFTALQRRGIPSRLLYFPTENHWILNPLHSVAWYEEVLGWMRKYTS
ncbi:unnamed protein product [Rotaria sordida]|uniref:Peptidase S9 prolyl oligopeptidase catalytic domain-containing protein n=1 Tax=Rotaria sordida TaxID=392033 RepID=A0A815QJX3_9BILA|nr:unnamed protein product [Rotaria sordida]CAF1464343.1 unnamed protein product [Rotaria sordida]